MSTDERKVTVAVTRSAGIDGAVVVFIDTDFEPDASDGGPGLRVLINDHDTYAGVAHEYDDTGVIPEHEAPSKSLEVALSEIDYIEEN